MLYVLIICIATMRIYFSLFYLFTNLVHDLFGWLLLPMLKINLGVVQCWILFELALRVTINIRQTESIREIVG